MKKILFLLLFLISIAGFGQDKNYYVSMTDGDDARTTEQAQNPLTPWKTINKVDNISFQADDSIFFDRGDTWRERFYIYADVTEGHDVVITAYGTGAKPIISAKDTVSGWSNDASWTEVSSNVWRITFLRYSLSSPYRRIWIGDTEYHVSENLVGVTSGKWYYDVDNEYLYVYATANPGTTVNAIWSSWIKTRTTAIQIDGAHYITIKNIACEGQTGISVSNSAGITIDSCKMSSWYGVVFSGSGGAYTEDCELMNTVFDPEGLATTGYTFNPQYSYDAIEIQGGSRNILAHDNYVKNYGHNSLYLISTTDSEDKRIDSVHVYDNFFTSPDLDYGGRVGADYVRGVGNKIYRNLIQNISVSNQFNGNHLEFFYNIIDTIKASLHAPGNAVGIISSGYSNCTPNNMKFYNNVIANVVHTGIYISWYTGRLPAYNNQFINNIVYNPGKFGLVVLNADSIHDNSFRNNIFYKSGDADVVSYRGDTITVAEFNEKNSTNDDVILSNLGSDPSFIVGTFELAMGSPAINSGLDVGLTTDYALTSVPQGIYPDRGAYEFEGFPIDVNGLGWEPVLSHRNFKGDVNIAGTFSIDGVPIIFSEGTPVNIPGLTATANELNKLDGATVTTTEINYSSGVTSGIQNQFDTITTYYAKIYSAAGDTSNYPTPDKVGDMFVDTTSSKIYVAVEAARGGWVILNFIIVLAYFRRKRK